jgi:hypothetical protein
MGTEIISQKDTKISTLYAKFSHFDKRPESLARRELSTPPLAATLAMLAIVFSCGFA